MGYPPIVPMGPSGSINPQTGLTEDKQTPEIVPLGPSRQQEIQYLGDTGVGQSKFDTGLQPHELGELGSIRAARQSTGGKAFNALVGGITSGVLTAVEDLAYLGDISNNIQRIAEMEEIDSNWLADWAKKQKENLDKAMPIYKRSDKVFDWGDPGFYFSALKGILDSAVGFAIPGMAASKAIGGVQTALRLGKYTSMLTQSAKGQQLVNAGLSGYITNFAEGKMMGVELFENAVAGMEKSLFEENFKKMVELNPELNKNELYDIAKQETDKQLAAGKRKEFEKLAGEQADTFINRNKMFAITDAVGLHGIYKGKGTIRNVLSPKGLKAGAKRFTTLSSDNMLLQASKEGFEEIGQNIAQMEGEYQAAKRADQKTEAPEDLALRIYNFGTSDQALLEGLMGVLGGGPQRLLTEAVSGNLSMSSKSRYKAQYAKQQVQIKANEEYVKTKLSDFARGQKLREEAIEKGEDDLDAYIKATEFRKLVSSNLDRGTIETLERNLQDAMNTSPEQAQANGWDPDYKQQAQEQLKVLADMEKAYAKMSRFENQKEMFDNRMTRDLLHRERIRYNNLVEETEMQLESDPNNPQLQSALASYKKTLDVLNGKIAEHDKAFKHMSTHKYQKEKRQEAKIERDQVAKNAKAAQDRKKKDDKKAKAKARQESNRKKQAEQTRKETKEEDLTAGPEEEVVDEEAVREGEEQVAAETGPVQGPEEDTEKDPLVADQVAEEITQEEADDTKFTEEGKEKFKNTSGELFDQLESESPTQQDSENVRMVRLLERMIDEYKQAVGRDEIEFAELIEALVDIHGVGRVEPLFGRIEALYKLGVDKTYEAVNYLSEFRRLSPNGEKELETAKKRGENADKGQFTKTTVEQNKKENDELEEAINAGNVKETDPDGNTEINWRKVVSGSNIIAYLSRKFEQIVGVGRKDVNDVLNEMPDKNILDIKKYPVGTKVRLVVEDNDDQDVYLDDKTKTRGKWGVKKADWRKDVEDGKITEDQYKEKYNKEVPIAIYVGEQKIGYLHTNEWINADNVSGDVAQDKARNMNIRNHIIAAKGQTYETSITHRSNGYLWRSVEGETTLSEAMPDKDLPLTVGVSGEMKLDRNTPFVSEKNNLSKAPIRDGVVYITIPVGNDEISLPLTNKIVGADNGIANTIMTAMEIFLFEKTDDESKAIVKYIKDATGYLITENNGISDFIQMYINNYDIGQATNLKKFLISVPNHVSKGSNWYMSLKIRKDGDVYFQTSRGDGVTYRYLSRKHIASDNMDEAKVNEHLQTMRASIEKMFSHVSLDNLNQNQKVPIISKSGQMLPPMSYEDYVRQTTTTPFLGQNLGTEENPNWVYTLQPVISMDFSGIQGEMTAQEQEEALAQGREFEDATGEERADELEQQYQEEQAAKKIEGIKTPKKYKRGGKLDLDDIESASEVEEDENQLFLRYLAEYSDPNVDPDRKAELQEILFKMYYAEGEMVSFEEKRNQARRKMGKDELGESLAAEPLTDKQLERMKNLAEARVKKGELKGVIISGLGATRQEQLVSFLRGKFIDALFSGKTVRIGRMYADLKKEFQEDLDTAQENAEIAQHNMALAEKEGNRSLYDENQQLLAESENRVREMSLIVDNWETLVAITDQEIQRIDSVKTVTLDDGEESREEQESAGENEGWINRAYENDPNDGLATQIKQFLSGINEHVIGEDGKPEVATTYWGDPKTMSYQELYNILQKLTPNLRPSFEEMMAVLEKIANDEDKLSTYPFMAQLVKKLRAAPEQVQNQFVNGMTNHDVDMRFIMFVRDDEGNTKLVEHQSNANSKAIVIQGEWYGALLASPITRQVEGGEMIIPERERKALVDVFRGWKKNPNQIEMRQWLSDIGITVTDRTWQDLVDGKIKVAGKELTLEEHVSNKGGLFRALADNIASRDNTSLITGDKLLDQTVVKALARHEADYALYSFGNSHRTGDRTVYSYSQNKYLVNRVRDLKDFRNGQNPLIDALASISFSMGSGWLEQMKENGGKNDFHANFNRWLFSLEPLKREGSKGRKGLELQNLSDGDIERAKIGMMQGQRADRSGNNNRVIQLVYPTTSDKTTVMGLTVLAADLVLDEEGNITDTSLQLLFDRIVRSEIRRILSIQDQGGVDIDGYNEGGRQFLFFPELNKLPGVFEADGTLSEDIESDDMIREMKGVIKQYVESLVEEKLDMWAKNDIVTENENHLDSDFMNIQVAPKKNPLRDVRREARVRGAATDMVFQYLIGNAEMAMTFTGDPALFYKQAKVNRGKSRSNPKYDFEADAKETYVNIGKRLAGDIAPGYEIADAYDDDYTQIFIADRKTKSHNAVMITKLLDGQEAASKVEAQLAVIENAAEGKDKKKAESDLTDLLSGMKSAPYYAIEASDAQEYTTWKEHLHVMFKAGELSREEYDTAYNTLEKGDHLDKKLLAKVMQPMKPVFVDNIIVPGQDVERRMYIKSSSFPLLPQLTEGTDLDNLRQAIEAVDKKTGKVRVAYGTAVKVGNVTKANQLNIFGDDGKIKSPDQLDFSKSTMRLNRRGFRIQQRVPYDQYKAEINKVTQATKNLFINMLEVEGFKFKGKKYTGKQLQKLYYDRYNELHEIEKKKLLDEVTIDGNRLDRRKLRKTLLDEARTRNYPISDQELLHIDKELEFLAFSPSADKYESLLNSIVTNRVIRLKMPGKSYVLGSEEGFSSKRMTQEQIDALGDKGIIYTENWTGELLPAREGTDEEGNKVMLPAQAIVPWKMVNSDIQDKDGRIMKIADFIIKKKDGTMMIDPEKVPQDVLRLFGMRIPNQGPNSQSAIEIVGFLPESSGDLIIATKDYVVQMGSDFDVDKLYTYMYNVFVTNKGAIRKQKLSKEGDSRGRSLVLQNEIIDIHMAVHENSDPRVQEQVANPLGFWELDSMALDIQKWRDDRQKVEEKEGNIDREWDRTHENGFEVSSAGDKFGKQFSAFNAKLSTGETIEQAYQKAKGTGKGQAAADPNFDYWGTYFGLWEQWASENPDLMAQLAELSKGKVLTDKFAKTDNNQARALATLLNRDYKNTVARKMFTGLSDEYQRSKFKNATAGKDGVGAFSVDSMFNAVAQGKNLVYMVPNPQGEGMVPLTMTIGNRTSEGKLSMEYALDGETFISDIIAGYQSAAVDNEKEQILDKLNINKHTFKAIKILNQLGFTKEVPLFVAQDIIIDYVKELERLSSTVGGFVPNKRQQAMDNVLAMPKYTLLEAEEARKFDKDWAGKELTNSKLEDMIKRGSKSENYKLTQRAILEKFDRLNDLGLELQTVQSTINPDSRGIGKSVMESMLKEKQVFRLKDSAISNAERLIGEFKEIDFGEEEQYEEDGYVTKYYGGVLYAIKPETINGQAIVHGLFTNNELWKALFPYEMEGIEGIMDQMEFLAGNKTQGQVATQAENRYKIWNAIKSFVYSDDKLGLHDTTIAEERLRLLQDEWKEEEYEVNGVTLFRDVRTKESLASFLMRVKKTKLGQRNSFLANLETVVMKGQPSTIRYRASTAEKPNEVNMYIGIIRMLQSDKPILDGEGSPLKLNGVEYTPRMLAQDLILYSYITGGIQEAIQFVKYIPAAYLKSIPFANRIAGLSHSAEEYGVVDKQSVNKVQYTYTIPTFIEQYFQHNPTEVPQLYEDDIIKDPDQREKNWDEVTKFTVTEDARKRTGKEVIEDGVKAVLHHPYVAIRAGNSSSKMKLFRYDLKQGVYVQIDTLGTHGVSEYNKNTPKGVSIIANNKSPVPVSQQPRNPNLVDREGNGFQKPEVEERDPDEGTGYLSTLVNDVLTEKATTKQGVKEAEGILEAIVADADISYYSVLAEELLKHTDQLPSDIKIRSSNEKPPAAGKFRYGAKEVIIYNKAFVGNAANRANVSRVVLHELLHGLTGYKILYHQQVVQNGPLNKATKNVIKSIPNWQWTEKDEAAVKSLDVLRKLAAKEILKNPRLKAKYDAYLAEKKKRDESNAYYSIDGADVNLSETYGLTDTFEFVSEALTNPVFQQLLNEIDAPSGKTFWQVLKERLSRLFESILGVEVREGSVLEAAIYDSFDLMSSEKRDVDQVLDQAEQEEQGKEEIFKENGTYYRFVKKNGKFVVAEFSQGNTDNWRPLTAKKVHSTYQRLTTKSKEKVIDTQQAKKVDPKLLSEDNTLELPSGHVITFNEQQSEALGKIASWVNGPTNFFTLSGFAGTGKTTIILKSLQTSLRNKSVAVSAPTHKAKKVIGRTTKRGAETIHALLGLKPNFLVENLNPKNLEFARDPRIKVPGMARYKVVVIDEASMLNAAMVKMIMDVANKYGTKVIFMGDQAQIPPVGENLGRVFDSKLVPDNAHLDKVERQADGNPLFKIFDAIREDQTSPVDKYDHVTDVNERGEGAYFVAEEGIFADQIAKAFTSEEYNDDPNSMKVIAWRNSQVAKWNHHIRRQRMGENISFLEEGDIVMGYDTVMAGRDVAVENSADYVVVGKSDKTVDVFRNLEGYWVELQSLDLPSNPTTTVFVVDPSGPNIQKLDERLAELAAQAKALGGGRHWVPFFDYKEGLVLTKETKQMKKTIDFGYAITAHKAQGSTYTTVFVDETDMDKNIWMHDRHVKERIAKGLEPRTKKDIDTERNKIKYVALSRPTKNAIVLSDKTGDSRNTHVDRPVIPPSDPNLDTDLQDAVGDGTGEVIASLSPITPQEFVSDEDVRNFMKQCKG